MTDFDNLLPIQRDRLKVLRENWNSAGKDRLTQKDVCQAIGCSEASYRAWEHGDRVPDTIYLMRLSDLYGVSCDYILGLTGFKNAGNKEVSEITGLSDKSIEMLRYLNYSGNHYVYDHPRGTNQQTISFINRVLESYSSVGKDQDGDTKHIPTLFRIMEQYVCSKGSKGTISETDPADGSIKRSTGELILFEDNNMPSVFAVSELRREVLFSEIRGYLEHYRKEEELKHAQEENK